MVLARVGCFAAGQRDGLWREFSKNEQLLEQSVYADGVLIGWTGPRPTHTLRTGESGYYRISPRSLFGTTLWGPRDLYVPGEVRLGQESKP